MDHRDVGIGGESAEAAPVGDGAGLAGSQDLDGTVSAEGVHDLGGGFEGFIAHETGSISNFLELQAPNSFDTKKLEIGAGSLPMSTTETGGRFAPTAIRMRAVRRASAHPERKDFAEFLGITVPRLSNIENGFPISRDVQDRVISKLPWVSRDWLLDGNEGGLTVATLQRLAPLAAEESDRTVPRTRSRASASR